MLSPHMETLLKELQALSPMPDDDTLIDLPIPREDHPLEKLGQVFDQLKEEAQTSYPLVVVSALLEVFGIGDGMEFYPHIAHFIEAYPHPAESYPLIQQATKSANAGTRRWACYLLGRRRQQEDEPFLVACVHDEVAAVRRAALVGLIQLSQCYPMDHLVPLVEPLTRDEDWGVQRTAQRAVEMLRASSEEK
jgi:hypothetical protein